MYQHKSTTNLANFCASGKLGKLFAQAKTYNKINLQLAQQLPNTLKTLELCLIKNDIAILITNNPAVAFRAKQQRPEIITLLRSISLSSQINQIEIKIAVDK
ncbi:hypothetical protein [Candidatus Thioglobus sp.]|uniref:hypothetical protein n=1 Tax=Candidatus Thioglobus sp. TaxID=2026721 RepID=UPI003D0FD1A3